MYMKLLRKRLQDAFCGYDPNELPEILSLMNEDGSYSDINYADDSCGNWSPIKHLQRAAKLARAWMDDSSLLEPLRRTVSNWCKTDMTHPRSWWYPYIGFQLQMRQILICAKEVLDPKDVQILLAHFRSEVDPRMTGTNKLWYAEVVVFMGVITENADIIKTGRDEIAKTFFISAEKQEGIQVDGSFAQHGMQLYNHGYGRSMLLMMTNWLWIFDGTPYAFDSDLLDCLVHLYLNGTGKMGRYDRMDYSPQGREIVRCYREQFRFSSYIPFAESLMKCCKEDPETVDKIRKTIDFMNGKRDNPYEECNTAYWVLDYMIHHRNTFYSSVRMASDRVIGSDNGAGCGEDMLDAFGAYGLCKYMRDGLEYDEVFPTYNWGCMPGTTTPDMEVPAVIGVKHESTFVGSVSDGMYGLAAMDMHKTFDHEGETISFGGKKAYFFFDECVLHLGSDLRCDANAEYHTTFDQSLLRTDVIADGKLLSKNASYQELDCKYVWHDHKAYVNLDGSPLKLKAGTVVGNYQKIYIEQSAPTYDVEKDIFLLVKPHASAGDTYQYVVFPNIEANDVAGCLETLPFEILANGSVQAVAYKEALYCVFYEAGSIQYGAHDIHVDAPCMLILNTAAGTVHVSTPDRTAESVTFTYNGTSYSASMPEDIRYKGSSVAVVLA